MRLVVITLFISEADLLQIRASPFCGSRQVEMKFKTFLAASSGLSSKVERPY